MSFAERSFAERLTEDGRLRILQALRGQTDGRLGDGMIRHALDAFGHAWSRDRIRTEMRALVELRAATVLVDTPAALVIEITTRGLDHVARRSAIDGVLRPQPEE